MMMVYNVYSIFELKLYHMDIEILISWLDMKLFWSDKFKYFWLIQEVTKFFWSHELSYFDCVTYFYWAKKIQEIIIWIRLIKNLQRMNNYYER